MSHRIKTQAGNSFFGAVISDGIEGMEDADPGVLEDAIAAIEEEAVSEYREALLGLVEWWDKRVTAESSFEPGFTMSTYDDEDALDSLISKARSLLDRSGVTE